jgi:RNA 3'-terminal phosphate cyclase (ATP)
MAGVLACARICGAEVTGAEVGSKEIRFAPGGPVQPGEYVFDVSELAGQASAGAVTLLLQSLLLQLTLAEGTSSLLLCGGTHVAWSPPAHYVLDVLLPMLARVGVGVRMEVLSWGWYPKGGGEVWVEIEGNAQLVGVDLTERGGFEGLSGVAAVSNLPSHIPQRMTSRVNNLLKDAGFPAGVQPLRTGGASTGAGIFITVTYGNVHAGFSALGERGKPSEQVAEEVVRDVLAYAEADEALDPWLPDQLLVALALADGPSAMTTVRITRHAITNAAVIQQFISREIVIEGVEGAPGTIHVRGEQVDV